MNLFGDTKVDPGGFVFSPMNYVGGKRRLMPQLRPKIFVTPDTVFVDMFAGGGTVSANSGTNTVWLNDYGSYSIGMIKLLVETDPDVFIPRLDRIRDAHRHIEEDGLTSPMHLGKTGYDEIVEYVNNRGGLPDKIDFSRPYTEEERELWIRAFLTTAHCFSNQPNYSPEGLIKHAYANDHRHVNPVMRKNIRNFYSRMKTKDVSLNMGDFRTITPERLAELYPGRDVYFYADPPYLVTNAFYNDGWGEDEENDLYELLDRVDAAGYGFGLSNVRHSQGRVNNILNTWAEKYNAHDLHFHYGNASASRKVRSEEKPGEVFVTNRKGV